MHNDDRLRLQKEYEQLDMMPSFRTTHSSSFLKTRDGVGLLTEFWRPVTAGPVPTVVTRCCYPEMKAAMEIHGVQYASRGIAFVCNYCRGTCGSKGEWTPNINERNDGIDFLNCICSYDWVKCVGYWGTSYLAMAGWILADSLPEKVLTMDLSFYGTDRFASAYKDGLFRHDILTAWAMDNAGKPITADYIRSCLYRPHAYVDKDLWDVDLPWYRDWVTNCSRSDPYWNSGFWHLLASMPEKMRIPLCITEGWYDHHLESALHSVRSLSPVSAAHTVLRIGPWNHYFQYSCGEAKPCQIEYNHSAQTFRWFYQILVMGCIPEKRTECYVIGKNTWVDPAALQEEIVCSHLYLNGDDLSSVPGIDGKREYLYDPEALSLSCGGDTLFKSQELAGCLKQPPVCEDGGVLSFLSPPFPDGADIMGALSADLYVASTAQDTSFYIKFCEMTTDGNSYHIRGTVTTLGFRNGSPTRIPYSPNHIERIRLTCAAICWSLSPGSRLRVDISSTAFPEYSIHPNKAGIWSLAKKTEKAGQTVFWGESYPSSVSIPIRNA